MSNDSNVATVEQDGTVIAVGEGDCRITAYSNEDGNLKSSLDITVSLSDRLSVSGRAADEYATEDNAHTIDLEIDDTIQVVTFKNDVIYTDVTYSVDNEQIATISETGLLTGVAEGNVSVTVVDNADSRLTASCVFSVLTEIPVSGIYVHQVGDINAIEVDGGQLQMITRAIPSGQLYTDVTYSVDDESVATIDADTGLLTAVSNGSVNVTATGKTDTSLTSAGCYIAIVNQVDNTGDVTDDTTDS